MARRDRLQYAGTRPYADPQNPPDGKGVLTGDERISPGHISVEFAEEGHLVLALPPGEVITGTMALQAAEKIQALAGASTLPLLLVLTGVDSVSRSARDVFSAARSLSAVAVMGVSPVDRVIANFLLGGEVQPCPTRYFSSEPDALGWLKRFAV
ncbi:STAS/SEC14 domain-containing protein [Arthrobacter sp. zg-Y844]|uniref:DUF7793 family protein n=1 Tax=Arthrobacter sp. zg-Y844 TaxID=2964612 RepID=UPI002107734B|nr:STAS/SEC14 domain-containing protein [Arthrobacter sp. zg-Y844]MCQ1987817.1 STAS/SEC14 domain-containing protein [Arthrobacter sp. zg-Y844]